jgi:transcriptional regulator with XRE-family HTH domain
MVLMTDEDFLLLLKHRIRAARLQADLSQERMAELLNIGIRRYQRFEGSAISNFEIRTLLRIARATRVDIGDLLGTPTKQELEMMTSTVKPRRVKRNQPNT